MNNSFTINNQMPVNNYMPNNNPMPMINSYNNMNMNRNFPAIIQPPPRLQYDQNQKEILKKIIEIFEEGHVLNFHQK